MLEKRISTILDEQDFTWKVKDGYIYPNEEDITAALDEAARVLEPEGPGTRLEVGGLIIEKTYKGFDVYVFAGSYV